MNNSLEFARRLDASRRFAWTCQGQRETLQSRNNELHETVGRAKGRLAVKSKTDDFLQELQAASYENTVNTYGRLLTALTHDVLGQDINIKLELATERGLPALDIFAEVNGVRRDLYESFGGSLTNVVCLGLRTIATSKAKKRKFMALDEPDCWIKPDRVKAYFNVMHQLAERTKFQILVISHHSVENFNSGFNIIEVSGKPETGLKVQNRPGTLKWESDSQPGIRGIRMRNFAGYVDCWLPMMPGVNAIIGDNNIGKSRVMRLLRSVAYGGRGETSDEDIRDCGEVHANGRSAAPRRAEAEFHLENGRVLHWSREKRRNPVVLYRLTDADGNTLMDGGKEGVPSWVGEVLGIEHVEGLDIQLAHQKRPVFLLGEPASRRASVLSVGQETSKLREMIALHKTRCLEDNAIIKNGGAELDKIQDQLKGLEKLDDISVSLDRCEGALKRYTETSQRIEILERSVAQLEELEAERSRCQAIEKVCRQLPEIPDVSDRIKLVSDLQSTVTELDRHSSALASANATAKALEHLPSTVPELRSNERLGLTGRKLRDLSQELQCVTSMGEALDQLPPHPPTLQPVSIIVRAADKLSAVTHEAARLAKATSVLSGLSEHAPSLRPVETMVRAAERIEGIQTELKTVEIQTRALERLPDQTPVLAPVASLVATADRIEHSASELKALAEQDAVLSSLPENLPELIENTPLHGMTARLEGLEASARNASAEVLESEKAVTDAAMQVAEAVSDLGNLCPLCGSHIDHDHLLHKAVA